LFKVTVKYGTKTMVFDAAPNENLLSLLKRNNISIPSICGGRQFCGKCKVEILNGPETLNRYTAEELDSLSYLEREMGYHLACAVEITEDIEVQVVSMEEEARIMTDSIATSSDLEPDVHKYHLMLEKPDLSDQRSDLKRIEDALDIDITASKEVLQVLPRVLRDNDFDVTVALIEDELVSVEAKNNTASKYGIAVDIGTTTVVGFLMDMNTGVQLDVYSFLNPQRAYGADVISRIDHTIKNPEGLEELGDMIICGINDMVAVLAERNGLSRDNIYEMTLAGNTVMIHLFLKIPVKYIATSPFTPVLTKRYAVKAGEIDVSINPGGRIYVMPCVAAYVGADTVASIMACGMAERADISLMMDIGTNGEIALGNRDAIYACSTAAGPAFEGAHIRNGMGGVKGAINKIRISDDIEFTTIGGAEPIGICGSGLVDAVSEMLRVGIIDESGRIKTREELDGTLYADKIIEIDGKPALLIAHMDNGDSIAICQKDIRELQLAKAAMAAGVQVLMKEANISIEQIENVYLAGGFGNYIDYDSACNIGLLPSALRSKMTGIGNGAGAGAKMCLLSKRYANESDIIKSKVHYIELSARKDFQDAFIEMMMF